jgi:hypothetical protein
VIVVLVPHLSSANVFEATEDAIVRLVTDTSATGIHVATIPPGAATAGFEGAWVALTLDMQTAQHFVSLQDAQRYYSEPRDGCNQRQHLSILDGLARLEAAGSDGRKECVVRLVS